MRHPQTRNKLHGPIIAATAFGVMATQAASVTNATQYKLTTEVMHCSQLNGCGYKKGPDIIFKNKGEYDEYMQCVKVLQSDDIIMWMVDQQVQNAGERIRCNEVVGRHPLVHKIHG